MREELAVRRARVTDEFRERKLDALVVTCLPNVRYLGGFTGTHASLLLSAGEVILFTDPRYTIRAAEESDCNIKIVKGSLLEAAAARIARKKWKRIGVEQTRIGYGAYREFEEKLPLGTELKPIAGLIEKHRMVKSPAEIDAIRRSVLTNSRAFDKAITRLKTSTTESELAAELEYQMRRLGAEKPAFETIVASGRKSALPHAQPTSDPILQDRLLLVDMGAVLAGYCSDMTRMLHRGTPGAKAKKFHKAVLEAQLAAIDAVRENVTANAVDRKARQVLKSYGFESLFVHSTGHGLGLEIHEPPRIGKRDKTRLQAGIVITIEPGAYLEAFGGVRIEDTVAVTATGCEVLTPTPKDLLVV